MDVVYLCRPGRNEELRFSLRSLANLPHDNVWVVGGRPSWYMGRFEKVPPKPNKYEHGRANLVRILQNRKISDPFVLFNDDFFVVRPVDEVPVLHGGRLHDLLKRHHDYAPNSRYTRMLARTIEVLADRNVRDPLAYNLHVPMVMWKSHLAKALRLDGSPRSLVGNLFEYGGEFAEDVKVHRELPGSPPSYDWASGSSPFLSTDDHTFAVVRDGLLADLFPERSPWEA